MLAIFLLANCHPSVPDTLSSADNFCLFFVRSAPRMLGWDVPAHELVHIPEHWLSFPEPEHSMQYMLGLIYIGLTFVALTGNGLVIWIFSSCVFHPNFVTIFLLIKKLGQSHFGRRLTCSWWTWPSPTSWWCWKRQFSFTTRSTTASRWASSTARSSPPSAQWVASCSQPPTSALLMTDIGIIIKYKKKKQNWCWPQIQRHLHFIDWPLK